jgi:hypothetical protein
MNGKIEEKTCCIDIKGLVLFIDRQFIDTQFIDSQFLDRPFYRHPVYRQTVLSTVSLSTGRFIDTQFIDTTFDRQVHFIDMAVLYCFFHCPLIEIPSKCHSNLTHQNILT